MGRDEVLEGYVVDIACLRKYPREDLAERGRAHTRTCALMGHCIESGYGLVHGDGGVALLDAEATPHVVSALWNSDRETGIRLRVHRRLEGKEMKTERLEEVE